MEEGLFHNPTFVQHIAEFAVAAIGHHEGHTEETRPDPMTGAPREVCPVYESIPCQAHQVTYQQAGNAFEFSGVPASFVTDSSGKMLQKLSGQSPQTFISALNEAQQTIGKRPVTGSMLAKMAKGLLQGDAKLRKGKYGDALEAYQKVAEDQEVLEMIRTRAAKRIEALGAAVQAAVEEAAALEPRKAKRALKKLLKQLDAFEEARAACEEALGALD